MKKKLLNKKGFTLIELIVVIAILAILALILVPSITGYIEKANKSKNEANARTLYSQVMLDVSTGDIIDGGNREIGEVTCTWTLTADGSTIDDYDCVITGTTTVVATPFLSN